jgi:inhibitor of cysteine peptidase
MPSRTAWYLIATILLLVGLLAGCPGGHSTPEVADDSEPAPVPVPTPAPEPEAAVTVTESDLGGGVELAVGERLLLTLPDNPTTGFEWRYDWQPFDYLALLEDSYRPDQPVSVGSGGTRELLLEALQAGEVTVTLQYLRPWEGGDEEQPQTLKVTVTP